MPCAASWATWVPTRRFPSCLEGLRRLEYRGYDSAGVAVLDGGLSVVKRAGKLAELEAALGDGGAARRHRRDGAYALGDARRTHRSQRAPAQDCRGRIAVIHNGIIENFQTLRARLEKDGHALVSETDTECVAHLIEENVRDGAAWPTRVRATVRELQGAYALVVVSRRTTRPHRRGEGLLAARGRARRRREPARVGHPRAARADHDRDPGRGGPGGRGPARRRRVHRPRREPVASRAHRGRLGRRARAEGRLRGLHAEGDPRAARRDPRHAGRSRRRTAA